MNIRHTLIAASALALAAGAASAQTILIQPEQETVIREYIVAHPAPVVELPDGVAVEVGTTLPEVVEVVPVEVPDFEPRYSYVRVDDRTLVVEPETRRVLYILD